jgi:hypothetical protein
VSQLGCCKWFCWKGIVVDRAARDRRYVIEGILTSEKMTQ